MRSLRFFACALPLLALGAWLSPHATAVTARFLFEAKVVGLTSMILVQLVHDAVPLAILAVGTRFTQRWHGHTHVLFVVLAALLLALLEPLLSARIDTVWAAWQGLRLVARLSAALFAITLAAYWER